MYIKQKWKNRWRCVRSKAALLLHNKCKMKERWNKGNKKRKKREVKLQIFTSITLKLKTYPFLISINLSPLKLLQLWPLPGLKIISLKLIKRKMSFWKDLAYRLNHQYTTSSSTKKTTKSKLIWPSWLRMESNKTKRLNNKNCQYKVNWLKQAMESSASIGKMGKETHFGCPLSSTTWTPNLKF